MTDNIHSFHLPSHLLPATTVTTSSRPSWLTSHLLPANTTNNCLSQLSSLLLPATTSIHLLQLPRCLLPLICIIYPLVAKALQYMRDASLHLTTVSLLLQYPPSCHPPTGVWKQPVPAEPPMCFFFFFSITGGLVTGDPFVYLCSFPYSLLPGFQTRSHCFGLTRTCPPNPLYAL